MTISLLNELRRTTLTVQTQQKVNVNIHDARCRVHVTSQENDIQMFDTYIQFIFRGFPKTARHLSTLNIQSGFQGNCQTEKLCKNSKLLTK